MNEQKKASKGVDIRAQQYFTDGKLLTSFCCVTEQMDSCIGADGCRYALKFESRLPDPWQGRLTY